MAGKHPKKRSVVPDGEPVTASRAPASDVSPAELRAQMAILAEQVRRLGDRVDRTDDGWSAPPTEPPVIEVPPPSEAAAVEPAAPSQPPSAPPTAAAPAATGDDAPAARAHVVSEPFAYVRPPAAAHPGPPPPDVASLPAAAPPAAEHDEQSIAERTSRLIASVIAMAERAAEQILESAEREAAAIRAGGSGERAPADRRTADRPAPPRSEPDVASPRSGLDLLERQRQALEALAAESDRIEAATERLREQAHALDAERRRLDEAIAAARRTS
jgi:hypothetical protein